MLDGVTRRRQPGEGSLDVRVFRLEPGKPSESSWGNQGDEESHAVRPRQTVRGVGCADTVRFAARMQLLTRKLVNRLQHPVAGDSDVVGVVAQQVGIDERGNAVDGIEGLGVRG